MEGVFELVLTPPFHVGSIETRGLGQRLARSSLPPSSSGTRWSISNSGRDFGANPYDFIIAMSSWRWRSWRVPSKQIGRSHAAGGDGRIRHYRLSGRSLSHGERHGGEKQRLSFPLPAAIGQ